MQVFAFRFLLLQVFLACSPDFNGGDVLRRGLYQEKTKGDVMSTSMWLIIAAGILAIIYGIHSQHFLAADAGNERMQEIASAIQEGAGAYLNRQYRTIGIVGVVIALLVAWLLGVKVSIGFIIGAALSGLAGYVGMLVHRCAPMCAPRKQPVRALPPVCLYSVPVL